MTFPLEISSQFLSMSDTAGNRGAMKKTRKNPPQELEALQNRLRILLHANMAEMRRTAQLLRDAERIVEDRFGQLDSLETTWEIAARKFRKKPNQDTTSGQ
jgi:hypothetical protein